MIAYPPIVKPTHQSVTINNSHLTIPPSHHPPIYLDYHSITPVDRRRDIIFTSGSTESINLAIQGTIQHLENKGIHPHIALSAVEHKAVLVLGRSPFPVIPIVVHDRGAQRFGASEMNLNVQMVADSLSRRPIFKELF